ncbi:bifunctional UDP-sugar hydrolase/5'-nucleotidase [Ancylomarina sp. 16SWW S1-10-2]|uniref:bifunctional metallophosphatase/5'-nucleotidase n=1 Tax=Ancylomarina sp. 16SWW S1-10-2 TaxID=2499681 RepID=UPI0012AD93F7|nr:5'-nucleotidase C-terminal domain-containing protein [Ancylomarina sp. 16SWW S1-10-2]MRT94485.1 bifunctional metallophosphatase/5'-nucleotidase [Ancylomarina sp. 16SWW S1-10-2]
MLHRFLFFIFLLLSFSSQAQKVDLLYFTDAHQIYPVDDVDGGRGGVARLKTLVDQAKESNPNTIVIHGGDLCGGVLFGGMYKGLPMIEAFNQIPVDVCNFGQHEFDYGAQHCISLLAKSKSEWLSSNLKNRDGDSFANLPKYIIKEVDGFKIALLGLTDAMNTSVKDDCVIQLDLIDALTTVLKNKDIQNANFLVVISQTNLAKNRQILDLFPEVDLILTEEQFEYESNIFYKGSVPIVSTAGNMSSLARIRLEKNKKIQIEITPIDSTITPDSRLHELEQFYKNDLELKLSRKLSILETPLSFRNGIYKESLAGNLITDAFRELQQSDVAIINGSGIRADIPAGEFTVKSARSLLPFGNKICQIALTVSDLKEILKQSAEDENGNLLQVSGICYQYSSKSKEIKIQKNNKELNDEEWLTLSLNSYLLHKLEDDYEILIDEAHSITDYEALYAYCEKRKTLHPSLENRLTITDKE